MRILVTGGAGFIGSNYVRQAMAGALQGTSEIVVLDSFTYAGVRENLHIAKGHANFKLIEGDIRNSAMVKELIHSVDAVINFAAESHVDRSIENSSEFVRTNVLGTQVLLEAAKINNLKKFLQVSTDEVYGSIINGSWDENQPLLPNSPYSASKASADLLVRAYFVTHGLNVSITRSSNNFGPKQDPEKLIPSFILKLNKGEKVPVYGDGLNVRDWLFVEDHCNGIYITLTQGAPGEIYNIGGGSELNNLSMTRELLRLADKNETSIEFVSDRLGHDYRYSVDYSKLGKLGYKPSMNFEHNLKLTYLWYLKEYITDSDKNFRRRS
jgi:dTDP-glucose 4,6-dehydratase